jgi:hypothetical protein
MKYKIDIPGRVWWDALDPNASGMQAELGLSEPTMVKRGKGMTFRYEDVPSETALEIAEYIGDRGSMLLGQSISDPDDPDEKAARDTLRSAVKTAERIRELVRNA